MEQHKTYRRVVLENLMGHSLVARLLTELGGQRIEPGEYKIFNNKNSKLLGITEASSIDDARKEAKRMFGHSDLIVVHDK